jgi:hypothetical protein
MLMGSRMKELPVGSSTDILLQLLFTGKSLRHFLSKIEGSAMSFIHNNTAAHQNELPSCD